MAPIHPRPTAAESDSTEIQDAGIAALCEELGISPEDIVILVISFHMKAKEMCIYTKDEFIQGMTAIGCAPHAARAARTWSLTGAARSVSTVAQLKKKLPDLRAQLDRPAFFKVRR